MIRKKVLPVLIAGALTLVAVFGAVSYQKVWAQSPTPTPSTGTPSQTVPDAGQPNALPGRDGLRGELRGIQKDGAKQEDLAAALGITVEELQAAHQTANEAALAQAVSQGLITQAQADQMKANGLNGRPMLKLGRNGAGSIDYDALLADALGISTDELKAARTTAFSAALDRAVQAGSLTQEQADLMLARNNLFNSTKFQTSMQSAFQAAVQQAVTDGTITQSQADQILAENSGMQFFGGRGGHGGPGGHGRGGPGGFPGAPVTPDQTTPAAPITTGA